MRLPFATYGRDDLALTTLAWIVTIQFPLNRRGTGDWLDWCWWTVAVVVTLVWLFLLNFFRDPERVTPQGEFLIISPADGTVQDFAEVDEPGFLGETASRIGIFLSPLNVHVNRMPMDCTVVQRLYVKGKMLKAYDPLAITENEACSACIEVLGGRAKLIVRQVTGAVARRIVCPVEPGQRYAAGQRYGMIKLGSRTEVWAPKSTAVTRHVKIGDKVRGGETVLGVLNPTKGRA